MSNRPLALAKVEYDNHYVLRPVELTDIVQIEKAMQASRKDLCKYMHWAHHPQSRMQFAERVVDQWYNYFKGHEYEMALFDKNGEFLVYSGFCPTLRLNPSCFEIGFWTHSDHVGKGLATLTTQIQIVLLFEYFHAERVEINCNIENKASLRVIEKCGFHYEGQLRNFCPEGTLAMIEQGYCKERRVALFGLIPEDRPTLPWYRDIKQKMTLFPLLRSAEKL